MIRRRQSSSNGVAAPSAAEPFGRPSYEIPDLPQDITIISDDRLMQLFTEYVAWQNYAATEFALAEVNEERAEATVKRLDAQGLVLGDPKSTVALTKAQTFTTKEMERAEQDRLNAYAARKMTQVVKENCERCSALVSRELSRRIGNADVNRRGMRWNP